MLAGRGRPWSASGITRSTRSIAPSMKTPVGSPVASRRIWPSEGAFVSRSTFGPPHRLGVGPAGVAVDPAEPDGPVGRDGVEDGGGRERAAGPEALVPAPADDPRIARRARRIASLTRRATSSSDATPRRSISSSPLPSDEVAVGVDQAGHGEGVGAVDDARVSGRRSSTPRRGPRRRRSSPPATRPPRPRADAGRRSRSAPAIKTVSAGPSSRGSSALVTASGPATIDNADQRPDRLRSDTHDAVLAVSGATGSRSSRTLNLTGSARTIHRASVSLTARSRPRRASGRVAL